MGAKPSSLRSKEISDYFEAKLDQLRPGSELPFCMHLYFPTNLHIILWRRRGDALTEEFLEKYRDRGVEFFWIHRDEREAFEAYLKEGEIPRLGEEIAALIQAELPEEEKAAAVAEKTQAAISELAAQARDGKQNEADRAAREIIADVLGDKLREQSTLSELWKLAHSFPELEHGMNVATYASLIALAFGRIQPDLIADLALSGFLHDVGISQLPLALVTQPWQKMSANFRKDYSTHVDLTLSLLPRLAPDLSPRVIQIISQHHEKFDGSGYPRSLQGFKIDDVSQLVAIADLIDSMCSGQWDGSERSLDDAFNTLEKLETSSTFPEYFNPEILAAILQWIRGEQSKELNEETQRRAREQRERIIGKNKGADGAA